MDIEIIALDADRHVSSAAVMVDRYEIPFGVAVTFPDPARPDHLFVRFHGESEEPDETFISSRLLGLLSPLEPEDKDAWHE